jgi:hypothetical protein
MGMYRVSDYPRKSTLRRLMVRLFRGSTTEGDLANYILLKMSDAPFLAYLNKLEDDGMIGFKPAGHGARAVKLTDLGNQVAEELIADDSQPEWTTIVGSEARKLEEKMVADRIARGKK